MLQSGNIQPCKWKISILLFDNLNLERFPIVLELDQIRSIRETCLSSNMTQAHKLTCRHSVLLHIPAHNSAILHQIGEIKVPRESTLFATSGHNPVPVKGDQYPPKQPSTGARKMAPDILVQIYVGTNKLWIQKPIATIQNFNELKKKLRDGQI